MSQFIQHPAASIRLGFSAQRAAWLVLLAAVLATAIVLIASNANTSTTSAQPATKSAVPNVRYDGGRDEGSVGPAAPRSSHVGSGPVTGGRSIPLHGGFKNQP